MSSDLSKIHFEGARIVRVIEDADRHRLTFEVSYPIPEGASDFPRRKIIFHFYTRYFVDEGQWMTGEATIQRVEITDIDSHRVAIRMHTDHGVREVNCSSRVLEESA